MNKDKWEVLKEKNLLKESQFHFKSGGTFGPQAVPISELKLITSPITFVDAIIELIVHTIPPAIFPTNGTTPADFPKYTPPAL